MKTLYKSNLYHLPVILLLLCSHNIFAQKQVLPDNLQLQFLKDSMLVESNSFAFNSCSIVYTGQGTLNIETRTDVPASINIITPASPSQYTLSNNQQQLIPVRFIAQASKAEWMSVTMLFTIRETGQQLAKTFWVKQKEEMKWKAGLMQPQLYVPQRELKTDVFYWIENTGNVADEYRIKVDSKAETAYKTKTVVLAAGEKQLITLDVDLTRLKRDPEQGATINISIKGKEGSEKLFIQKLSLIGNTFTQGFKPWKQMPLSIEVMAQQSPASHVIYSGGIQGTMQLSEKTEMVVDSRIYNLTEPQNRNHLSYLQFRMPNTRITAGSMIGFHHFLINGLGVNVTTSSARSDWDVAAIKGLINNTDQYKLQWNSRLSKRLNLISDNFSNNDNDRRVYSTLSVNTLQWKPAPNTSISVTAGGSYEQVKTWKDDRPLNGTVLGYDLQTEWKNFAIQSKVEEYSNAFSGFNRGFTFHQHELKKRLGAFHIGGFYQANKKLYTDTQDSLFTNLLNINNSEYGMKAGFNTPKFSFAVSSGFGKQQQDSMNSAVVESWRTTSNLIWRIGQSTTFSVCSNINQIEVNSQPGMAPIMAFNNFGSLQYKSAGIYFQYNQGPFYYFETKQYLQTNELFQRVQVAPYVDVRMNKLNTFMRWQLMYNKELPADFNTLALNNQLVFSPPKLKLQFGITSSYNFTNYDASFAIISVRKSLQLPVAKNKISNDFDVVLYKDWNNNNVYDEGPDEIVGTTQLIANGQLMQSDASGAFHFKNIGDKAIQLDLSAAVVNGWIPKLGYSQSIVPGKKLKTTYIAYKEASTIAGKLHVVADDKSNLSFDVNNIRITATDAQGHQHSTLTDSKGHFQLNLPTGRYIVSINQDVFDERFRPTDISKEVDLFNNKNAELQFEIREKRRQINIRKMDN